MDAVVPPRENARSRYRMSAVTARHWRRFRRARARSSRIWRRRRVPGPADGAPEGLPARACIVIYVVPGQLAPGRQWRRNAGGARRRHASFPLGRHNNLLRLE